ncbi:MAG: beta-hydroxyacyl-ACP dehydratase [Prevotella sp.]|jgi:predicted hotdog family 3-hydroxylacyl-ACP dehydratase|nr:beta-hydroxyacyl-ACP dehydratase [Prevotella sp.]
MRFQGEEIKRLIPQREPFIMVDEIETSDDTHAVTAITVRSGNYFMLPDGTMSETGLIEHIAQSCSALMGSLALGQECPPVGLIGEVKRFECQRRPQSDEKVCTSIEFALIFGNVTIATGESRIGKELIAKAQLKIFVQ